MKERSYLSTSKHDFGLLSDVREYYSLLAIDLRALNIFAAWIASIYIRVQ